MPAKVDYFLTVIVESMSTIIFNTITTMTITSMILTSITTVIVTIIWARGIYLNTCKPSPSQALSRFMAGRGGLAFRGWAQDLWCGCWQTEAPAIVMEAFEAPEVFSHGTTIGVYIVKLLHKDREEARQVLLIKLISWALS